MPFAGFLVAEGRMNLAWVTLVATLGSIVGSGLSYEMGKHLGRPFVERWGRWVLVTSRDLDRTDRFFRRWGAWAVLAARFVPVLRHLISIPAGVARMPLGPFLLATAIGAGIWNLFLAWVGLQLGANWASVGPWLEPFDFVVLAGLVVGAGLYVWLHVRRIRHERAARRPAMDE